MVLYSSLPHTIRVNLESRDDIPFEHLDLFISFFLETGSSLSCPKKIYVNQIYTLFYPTGFYECKNNQSTIMSDYLNFFKIFSQSICLINMSISCFQVFRSRSVLCLIGIWINFLLGVWWRVKIQPYCFFFVWVWIRFMTGIVASESLKTYHIDESNVSLLHHHLFSVLNVINYNIIE